MLTSRVLPVDDLARAERARLERQSNRENRRDGAALLRDELDLPEDDPRAELLEQLRVATAARFETTPARALVSAPFSLVEGERRPVFFFVRVSRMRKYPPVRRPPAISPSTTGVVSSLGFSVSASSPVARSTANQIAAITHTSYRLMVVPSACSGSFLAGRVALSRCTRIGETAGRSIGVASGTTSPEWAGLPVRGRTTCRASRRRSTERRSSG